MLIKIFRKEDYTKQGKPKQKNSIKELSKEDFIKYVKDNNLTLKSSYIDITGLVSNGENFKCFHNGFIVGVTELIKEVENERN